MVGGAVVGCVVAREETQPASCVAASRLCRHSTQTHTHYNASVLSRVLKNIRCLLNLKEITRDREPRFGIVSFKGGLQCLRHVHVLEFVRFCVRADVVEIEVRYLRHHGCHVLLLELHRLVPGGSVRGEQANLTGLILGWIEAKCCKKICVGICVGKLSPRSTQCTPLHRCTVLESNPKN